MSKVILGARMAGKTSKLLDITLENFLEKQKNVLYVSDTHDMSRYFFQKVMDKLIDKFGIEEIKMHFSSHKPSLLIEHKGLQIKMVGLEQYSSPDFDAGKYKDHLRLLDNLNHRHLEFDYVTVNGELEKDLNE